MRHAMAQACLPWLSPAIQLSVEDNVGACLNLHLFQSAGDTCKDCHVEPQLRDVNPAELMTEKVREIL